MCEYKYLSILLLIFCSTSQVQPWKCSGQLIQDTCYISETTLTLDHLSSSEVNGAISINLAHVDIPDPSPELFARLLDGVYEFIISQSTTAELYFPASLSALIITEPLTPLQIIIDRNISYRLEKIQLTRLASLPVQIENLHSLEYFYCFDTPIPSFDLEMFSKMVNITGIDISKTSTNFIRISDALQLPSLRTLRISNNHITSLNASGWNFPALEQLDLRCNRFTSIPKHIGTFENLSDLSLSENFILRIDLTIFTGMKQLQMLTFTLCHISEISSNGIVELPYLGSLHLNVNNLTELNVSSWYMPSLEHISLDNNHLQLVSGLSSSFIEGLRSISMFANPWNCSWLKQLGRETEGMIVTEYGESCSAQLKHSSRDKWLFVR